MIDYAEELEQIKDKKKVVLLQSGGLDSCYLACLLSRNGFTIHHLFVDYGQNAKDQEFKKAKEIVNKYGGELHYATINLPWLKDSTLLAGHKVEEYDVEKTMGCVSAKTYVPMRNSILLSMASSLAESLDIKYIASALDGNEDYYGNPLTGAPDKHPTYVKTFENALSEGSSFRHCYNKDFEIIAPTLGNTKEDTIQMGLDIDCDFSLSWTCYNNSKEPCGECCACIDRAIHFSNLGLEDPALKNKDKKEMKPLD